MTVTKEEAIAVATAAARPETAAGVRRLAPTMRGWAIGAAVVVAVVAPLVAQSFIHLPADDGDDLRAGDPRPQSVDRVQRPVLARAQRVLRDRRLYRGDPDERQRAVAYCWTLPAAGVVCFVVGFLFGLPALRLQNLYLALATFALATAMPQILKFHLLEALTGGVQGIVVDQPDPPPGLPIDADQWLYYFTLVVLLVMFAGAANLVRSRTGRAIMAIRDNPIAAAAMGINTSLYKTLTFGVSALYTGVAGALGAIAVQFVAPDSFTFLLSISFLVGLVVGGVGSIPGCLFGGLFVLFVPNIAESVSTGLGRRDLRRHPAARDLHHAGGRGRFRPPRRGLAEAPRARCKNSIGRLPGRTPASEAPVERQDLKQGATPATTRPLARRGTRRHDGGGGRRCMGPARQAGRTPVCCRVMRFKGGDPRPASAAGRVLPRGRRR